MIVDSAVDARASQSTIIEMDPYTNVLTGVGLVPKQVASKSDVGQANSIGVVDGTTEGISPSGSKQNGKNQIVVSRYQTLIRLLYTSPVAQLIIHLNRLQQFKSALQAIKSRLDRRRLRVSVATIASLPYPILQISETTSNTD